MPTFSVWQWDFLVSKLLYADRTTFFSLSIFLKNQRRKSCESLYCTCICVCEREIWVSDFIRTMSELNDV